MELFRTKILREFIDVCRRFHHGETPISERYARTIDWIMNGGADRYADTPHLTDKLLIVSHVTRFQFALGSAMNNSFLELLLATEPHWKTLIVHYACAWLTRCEDLAERIRILIAYDVPRASIRRHINRNLLNERTLSLLERREDVSLRRIAYYMVRRHAIASVSEAIKNDIDAYITTKLL